MFWPRLPVERRSSKVQTEKTGSELEGDETVTSNFEKRLNGE
jgi:hypothetical protein